jgi:enterochelin esterase-like enzyme
MNIKQLIALALLLVATVCRAATVDTLSVSSKYIDSPMKVTVIVPDATDDGTKFPSVYLLNGFSGNYRSWSIIQPRLPQLADLYGMVIVMPDGRDSWYWDSPINEKMQMESFFVNDLVPYVDAKLPTIPRADKRAITGLSMGGHGGLWLGLRHSDIWGCCGSTSGGVDIRPFPEKWELKQLLGDKAENPSVWNNYTVINLVPYIHAGQHIIFDCGTEDFFKTVNDNLHKALLDYKIPHDYISRPGAHNIDYWRNSILYQLLYFSTCFAE